MNAFFDGDKIPLKVYSRSNVSAENEYDMPTMKEKMEMKRYV